jgi:hypothetical protein
VCFTFHGNPVGLNLWLVRFGGRDVKEAHILWFGVLRILEQFLDYFGHKVQFMVPGLAFNPLNAYTYYIKAILGNIIGII